MLSPEILAAIDKAADELVAVAPPLSPEQQRIIRRFFAGPAASPAAAAPQAA